MAASAQLNWALVFMGTALLASCLIRDRLAALVTGGLVALVCVTVAVIHVAVGS
jgi:hypothetical protein